MLRTLLLVIAYCLAGNFSFSQNTDVKKDATAIFDKITNEIAAFKLDTSEAPADKITRKIIELRDLRGGFNINEAIEFKIAEDRQKKELPASQLDKLSVFFSSGDGKRWLDNAMIWIYRRTFTYSELKQLVKFYKTGAGQKMSTQFPVIMLQSLRAAEMIKEIYEKQVNMK